MNRTDLQKLADIRIAEAVALLTRSPALSDGAYYLAGYSVECALKACVAKMINAYDYPDKHLSNKSYTHNLETLHQVAGLEAAFKAEVTANAAFARNWIMVKDWNAESRYERHSHAKAQKIIDAITDTTNGLLPWIKARW